jgi:hypothetical protein
MSSKRIPIIITALVLAMLAPHMVQGQSDEQKQAVVNQEQSGVKQDQHTTATEGGPAESDEDQTMFYAFLQEDPKIASGPLFEILKDRPVIRELVFPRSHLERRFRPMAQWRLWSDKHQRFMPAFLFVCLTGFLNWSLFPSHLQAAAEECKRSFWKSFGSGLLLAIITLTILRIIFITEIGWPLGIMVAGCSQAAMIVGLSLSVFNLGHALSLLLRLHKIPFLANNPSREHYCDIFIGSIFAALILQIPPLGTLPRCGTRLLALFAVLGIGAIYRELKRRQAQNST